MIERSRGRAVGALTALSVGAFLYVANEVMPIGLLLQMSADLGVSPSAIGQLVTACGAVVVLTTIPLTILTGRVPRRLLLSMLLFGFVLTTMVSALASGYWFVLVARLCGALTQSLFWAVVVTAATELFPPEARGRVVAVVFGSGTIATVLGVPAGTWLGGIAGWRAVFLALAALGLVAFVVVAVLLPTTLPDHGRAARGSEPDSRRYVLLIVVAVLATAGAFAAFTYVAPFLIEVGGFTPVAIGPLLLVRGLASLLGIATIGVLIDRRPRLTTAAPVALQALALLGLLTLTDGPAAAVGLVALSGLSFAAIIGALGATVLEVAPGRSDLASAGLSTAINVGITAGALTGGLLLADVGIRSVILVGGIMSLAALVVAIVELRLRPHGVQCR